MRTYRKIAYAAISVIVLVFISILIFKFAVGPVSAIDYLKSGEIKEAYGKHDAAIVEFSRAIELNPNLLKAYSSRASIYADRGDIDLAINDYSRAIKINPKDFYNYSFRGYLYKRKQNYKLAISDFTSAILLDPKRVANYQARGYLYKITGRFRLAVADFTSAIELSPRDPFFYMQRGRIYFEKLKRRDNACTDFSQACELGRIDSCEIRSSICKDKSMGSK